MSGEGRASVWYNSRFYRVNLFWDKSSFRIRDIHLFDERYPERYLKERVTTHACTYGTLPVLDGDGKLYGIVQVDQFRDIWRDEVLHPVLVASDFDGVLANSGYGLAHATLTGQGRNPSPDFASGTTIYGFNTRVTDPNFVARICCNKPLWVSKTVDQALNIPEDGLYPYQIVKVPRPGMNFLR